MPTEQMDLSNLAQSKAFLEDLKVLLSIQDEKIEVVARLLQNTRTLEEVPFHDLVQQAFGDESQTTVLCRFVNAFGQVFNQYHLSLDDFAESVADSISKTLESSNDDIKNQAVSVAAKTRRILTVSYPRILDLKSGVLTKQEASSVLNATIICDLRPVFDGIATKVELLVPTFSLSITTDQTTASFRLSEVHLEQLSEEIMRAKVKQKVLAETFVRPFVERNDR